MAFSVPPGETHSDSPETRFVGEGCCGKVYAVVDEDGVETAAKYFAPMMIDRHWFAEFDARYQTIPVSHPGILPRYSADFSNSPNQCFSKLVTGTDGTARSAKKLDSLAVWTEEAQIWPYLLDLAAALAFLHRHHVVHANLHPANVFVTDAEESRIALTDYGQGYLGKMHLSRFSEGLWFAPPEQLRHPEGIAERHGYRWDVYRFGVVSYWLINGILPRGAAFAAQTKDGLEHSCSSTADLSDVDPLSFAQAIEDDDLLGWPKNQGGSRIDAYREVIDSCLSIDPHQRPADLCEVHAKLLAIDAKARLEDAENRITVEREQQKQKLKSTRFSFAIASLLAVLAIYGVVHLFVAGYRQRGDINRLTSSLEQQSNELAATDNRLLSTRHDLRDSRATADRFFAGLAGSITATNGTPGALIETTLLESRAYYEDLLASTTDDPGAAVEKARAHHHLAQIDLRLQDPEVGAQRLAAAASALEELLDSHGEDAQIAFDTHLRLADCYDLLTQLHPVDPSEVVLSHLSLAAQHLAKARSAQPHNSRLGLFHARIDHRLAVQLHAQRHYDEAIKTQVAAAKILQSFDNNEIDKEDSSWLMANIQFDTGRSLQALNRSGEAIDSCLAALETLEDLGTSQRHRQALLGRCYAELGSLFVQGKETGKSRKVLAEAIRLLLPLTEAAGDNVSASERADAALYLSRCYRHMAAVENADGKWSSALQTYRTAIEHLDEYTKETYPQHLEARLALAEVLIAFAQHSGKDDRSVSKQVDRAHSLAENVGNSLRNDGLAGGGIRRTRQLQLADIYSKLGDVSRLMRDNDRAAICYEVAMDQWTLLAGVDSAAWIQDRLARTRSQLQQVRQ